MKTVLIRGKEISINEILRLIHSYCELYEEYGIGKESWEKDRVYFLFALASEDDAPNKLRVICPLCGWVSKTYRIHDRLHTFSLIAKILAIHVKKSHGNIIERIEKGGVVNGASVEGVYKCKICGEIRFGFCYMLIHVVARHKEVIK